MEGSIVLILVTFSLVSLIFWWRNNKDLTRIIEEKREIAEAYIRAKDDITLERQKRYKDFATRLGVNPSCVEAAFVTLNLEDEADFQCWGQGHFIDWYNEKLREEGLFNSEEDRLRQAVDEIFKND